MGAWIEIPKSAKSPVPIQSLPPWERGLKYNVTPFFVKYFLVAPPVGAWIEILNISVILLNALVAPPVGAWIEIFYKSCNKKISSVAPPVGAWIEICCLIYNFIQNGSLPPWERGLKLA